MKNLCTLSDKNYLTKGLVLYDSLLNTTKDFILYYLCLDDHSFNVIKKINNESIIPIHVDALTESDSTLKILKEKDYKYFCFCLASYLCHYLIKKNNIDSITYIDSDIFFHENIDIIFNEIGDKEVGIFKHRQFKYEENRPEGSFNVGIVHFKNKQFGIKALEWWQNSVLNRKNLQYGTCGDQKYLDFFVHLCPEEKLFIDGNVGHGAPWQWQLYDFSDYEKDGTIIWNGNKQKLIFTHFSQFKDNNNSYIPSTMHHIYTPLKMYEENKSLKTIYDNYFKKIKAIKTKIQWTVMI